MSKRSSFEKVPKDFYATVDPNAIPLKLIEFVRGKSYASPCYGNGDLEDLLMDVAICRWRSDIRKTVGSSKVWDATCLSKHELERCDIILENPPYTKDVLLPMIDRFMGLKPTWLLLPADLMHNKYFRPYMKMCNEVISVGRLYWFTNDWVVDKELPLGTATMRNITRVDHKIGREYYTGWWDSRGNKPAKSEYTRGTDNHCWFFWSDANECDTVFHTRGD